MNLHDEIESGSILLIDGAMGTLLETSGLEMGGQNCISHPSEVLSAHKSYSDIGCEILTTNTLTMNRISIESHRPGLDVREVNLAGARLAKQAASKEQYILGDISSTGQLLEPYGDYTEKQFYTAFREQAEYLLEGGVDGFIVETILDLREALCALKACRDISSLPVLVTLSFQTAEDGGRTIMGSRAGETAASLVEAGASAVGANCGTLDPYETSLVISIMRKHVEAPLIAQPNAGKPRLVDGQTIFDMTPQDFADGITECIRAGANIVGGCCGTTPEHIQEVADKVINKVI